MDKGLRKSMSMRQAGITLEKCYCIILMLLMISMLVFPVSYQKHKIILLAVLLGVCFYSIIMQKCHMPKEILCVMSVYVLYNMISILRGILLSTPGAIRVSTTEIVWPIFFVLLFCAFPDKNVIDYVFRGIIVGIWVVSLMDLLLLLTAYGMLPLPMALFDQIDLGYYVNPEGRAFTSGHMVSYLYGIPFVAGLCVVDRDRRRFWPNLILLFLEVFIIALSGRRAMFLLVAIMPFFGYFVYRYSLSRSFFKLKISDRISTVQAVLFPVVCAAVLCLMYVLRGYISFLIDTLLEGFDFKNATNADAYVRGAQFSALMNGWLDRPFFGNGAGSFTAECIRSLEQLWAYELSYCALLFQKGLVGFFIFFYLVLHAFRESKKKIWHNKAVFRYCYPALMGMTGVLIGNATNPYLGKFSCIWYLFLAVALPGMLNFKNELTL